MENSTLYSHLVAGFPGKVQVPGTTEYNTNKFSYFAAFENEVSPACFLQPETAQDVSEIMKFAHSPSLDGMQTKFAIRSGGHTAWAGAANIEEGVTIDLSHLKANTVVVDKKSGLATIGAGARWGDVYEDLMAEGLAVVGGRVTKVGVGGLSLGGGLSYFSPERGFVCDDIVNYEVVLASGKIVQANKTENSDLFVALKGGSNNFGIVTSFQKPTFKVGKMWGGVIFYEKSAYPSLLKAFGTFSDVEDEHASLVVATSYISGMGEIAVSNLYYTLPEANPPSLEPFIGIEPKLPMNNTLRIDSHLGFAQEQAGFSTNGARQWFFTTSFRVDVNFMLEIHPLWLEAVAKLEGVEGLMFSLVYQPVTKGAIARSLAKGPNSLGLEVADGPFVVCLLNTVHANAKDDDLVSSNASNLIQQIDELASVRGVATRYRFLNYAYETQKVLESYGADNVAKLKAVSDKYDPTKFFQTRVPGGFKISHVAV